MQFAIIACALFGVALGQYNGYQGYQGFPGYQGYQGYAGYQGYQGYPGYQGYNGYQGIRGYQGYQGFRGFPQVKPAEVKAKETPKTDAAVEPTVAPVLPVVPVAKVYNNVAPGPYIAIRSQDQDSYPDGSYRYSFQTENGISVAESGTPSVAATGEAHEVVQGEFSYPSPDGRLITVRYTADKDGFHPEGEHLPGSSAYTAEPYRPYGYQKALPLVVEPVVKPVVVPVAEPEAKAVAAVESEKKDE